MASARREEQLVLPGHLTGMKFDMMTREEMEKFSVLKVEVKSDLTSPKMGIPNTSPHTGGWSSTSPSCATCGGFTIETCHGHSGYIELPEDVFNPYFVPEIVEILNKICPWCNSIRHEHESQLKDSLSLEAIVDVADRVYDIKSFCINLDDSRRVVMLLRKLFKTNFSPCNDEISDFPEKFTKDFFEASLKGRGESSGWHPMVRFKASSRDMSWKKLVIVIAEVGEIPPRKYRTKNVSDVLPVDYWDFIPNDPRQPKTTPSSAKVILTPYQLRASSSTDSSASKCGARYLRELVFGKLTDSSFRMVVVGDPKVRLNEIGISEDIAESLEIFELVSTWNLAKLKKTRLSFHPRRRKSDRGKHVHQHPKNKLEIGTEIRRPLENGDVIMINRPPSVHQHSIIALSVRILPPNSVISINPLCCAPLFGDFDGDCLHGYIPQSLTSRIELKELVHMNNQLLNSQDGRSLLSLSQDSLTAAHLLTGGDVFLNKVQMQQLEMLCARQSQHPTIFSSSTQTPLWTGNQLFSMCLPKNLDLKISDSVEIRKGELLFAPNGSSWLQNTSSGIFSALFKYYQSEALDFLFSAQDVLCEWLSMRGLSVTLRDMNLSPDSNTRTKMMEEVRYGLQEALEKCHVRQLMTETTILDSLEAEDIDEGPYPSSTLTSINRDSLGAFRDVFHDIQNVVQSYASKENSMLAMVHSGSVGSMTKLVQQGVCLGVHHPAIPLPFKFPHRLSCDTWVQQKVSSTDGTPKDIQERVNVPCAVMENSFLSGLNPLECFFHALVSRNNLFSENAAIPGTLNRKLMYYMCDISVAYDGTVRNAYGNQIIQFSYGIPEVTSGDKLSESDKFIGQPVGALAASAISEAAYGALEFPVTKLQASPLMNLKERMLKRGLTLKSIIDAITKKYDSVREGTKIDLPPRLYISSRECSELEKDGSFCIRAMTEISKTSTSLETIRDVIIPELLKTVMKGFVEFKKVDILWDELPSTRLFRNNSFGELSLKGLKSATSDAGRSIHPRHLLITADCMSVTGEFLGLNAKAIKQQRKQASVSSPFMQSCFSTPGTCLIKAAKDGARDDLVGAIDAAAWGKKTPVGTGGSFEILYTGKGIDIEKPENIYETLCSQSQILGGTEAKKQPSSRKNIKRRSKSIPVHRGSKVRRHAPLTSKLNRVQRSFGSWKSMEDMHTSLQRILFKYPIGSSLDKMDASIIFEALLYHPNKDAKLALEPQEIKVDYNKDHPDTRCFFLVGKDGTIEDFSYHKCIRGAAQLFAQEKPLKKKSRGKR
ncbi:DNA-directed RNA polymerase D subunit 1 [Acorus gramineus]|uniref:DNA-directed RNA polymerase subunit n=1 Tax=Acorus gramineus TaxID=55184 RepID=A0AAV9ACH8_ACOGR|nr:DNA-directed RNA polymerase D subunit 1 [Acorus gramineus]